MSTSKMGRPTKELDYRVEVRLNKKQLEKLDKMCKAQKKTRSEMFRTLLEEK